MVSKNKLTYNIKYIKAKQKNHIKYIKAKQNLVGMTLICQIE